MPIRHRTFGICMDYTHVIWDFNGTVLCDMEAGIRATNEMLAARGLPQLSSLDAYREVFDFPVEDYYRRIGLDLEKEDFKTVLAPLWVSLYNMYSKTSPIYPGVREVVGALRARGVRQSILSASEREMMCAQLRERDAEDLFDEIWGTGSIHAYGKGALADAWRAAHQADRVLLLGDTTHDFEVAERIGADCILIANGHHSAARLVACGVPVLPDLAAFLQLLNEKG